MLKHPFQFTLTSLLGMLLLGLLAGCASELEESRQGQLDPNFFDASEFFETEAGRLSGLTIEKTVTVNGNVESKTLSNVDWTEEFAPFAQSNIDRPALWDVYQVDTLSAARGLWSLVYSALDSSLFTKVVAVTYADIADPLDSVYSVSITNSFDRYVADTRQILRWRPGNYQVQSTQEGRFIDRRDLEIIGNWKADQ